MRNRRNTIILALLVVGSLTLALLLRGLIAQPFTMSDHIILTQNYELAETVPETLVVAADTIRLDETSRVQGDAALAGRSRVEIDGQIDGTLTVMGDQVFIGEKSHITGDVSFMGREITVAGRVDGSVTAVGSTLNIDAPAHITGTLTACVDRLNGDTVEARACRDNETLATFAPLQALRDGVRPAGVPVASLIATLPAALALAALAALAVTIFPRRFSRLEEALLIRPRQLATTGCVSFLMIVSLLVVGLLLLAFLPPLGLILLPFSLLLGLVLLVLIVTGWVTSALLVGDWLLRRQGNNLQPPLVTAILGSLILCLLAYGLALAPFSLVSGGVIAILLAVIGLGATTTTRCGTRSVRRRPLVQG